MALIRDVANADEAKAGGLVASRPGEFEQRYLSPEGFSYPRHAEPVQGLGAIPWLEQRSYFTTNPSLMRRAFMAEQPFLDDGGPYCEGRYGIRLRDLGYTFGAWGSGEEWVAHMGVRDASGTGY
jgi:hypothetical protein